MNFCSRCGQPIAFGYIPEEDTERFHCPSCGAIHYENPKLVVGTLPRRGDQVLLCKRAIEPCQGLWTLPAGFMEMGETVEQGAIRETLEEASAQVEIVRLFSIYSLPRIGQIYMIFLADLINLDFHPHKETSETRLFSQANLPFDEIAFTAIRFTLEKYFFDSSVQLPFIGSSTPSLSHSTPRPSEG
jgi:ADP-ribose pyrophosphatase YjhB (NUDIX family)